MARRYAAEFLGTALLVFFGAGVATLVFGFRIFGGAALAAGMLTVALAFGLVLMVLAYVLGPISGCHVNPAVTLSAYLTRRIPLVEAIGYWIAQFVGGYLGSLLLFGLFNTSPYYFKPRDGLGANGYGRLSFLHITAGGAFLAEVILTAFFVFIVLGETRKKSSVTTGGLVIGLALAAVYLFGIPIDGTSVNPARSLGPALVTGGLPLSQVWLFIVAPLVGALLAAGLHLLFYPPTMADLGGTAVGADGEHTLAHSAADEAVRPAGQASGAAAGYPAVAGRGSAAAPSRVSRGAAPATPGSGTQTPGSQPPDVGGSWGSPGSGSGGTGA